MKKALEENNLDEIKKTMESLTEAVYAVTTKIYQKVQAEQAAAQQQAGPDAGPPAARPSRMPRRTTMSSMQITR